MSSIGSARFSVRGFVISGSSHACLPASRPPIPNIFLAARGHRIFHRTSRTHRQLNISTCCIPITTLLPLTTLFIPDIDDSTSRHAAFSFHPRFSLGMTTPVVVVFQKASIFHFRYPPTFFPQSCGRDSLSLNQPLPILLAVVPKIGWS